MSASLSGRGDDLGVALIGAGLMGSFHARTLASTPGVRLRRVAEPDAELAARAAALAPAVVAGPDPLDAIADDRVHAVVIASPAATHGSLIEAAARAGKAIFCEKPLGVSLEVAERAAGVVRASGVPFQIGFQRRFDPGIARLLATVREGALGGAMTDARFEALAKPDTTVLALRFASGALGVIENRLRTGYGYETVLEVSGSTGKGVVRADELDRLTLYREGRIERAHVPWYLERIAVAYRAELEAFFAAISAGAAPTPGIGQGVRVLAACEAAERSYRERRPIEPVASTPGASGPA